MDYKTISDKVATLSVFRNLREDPVIAELTAALSLSGVAAAKHYAAFVGELYEHGSNLTDYILNAVCNDDNSYIKTCAKGKTPAPSITECMLKELVMFEELSKLTPAEMKAHIGYDGFLGNFETGKTSIYEEYIKRSKVSNVLGYGIFSMYHVFMVEGHRIVPVKTPDAIDIASLSSYEYERGQVVANTKALVEGKPAANTLLYGDAGTGKSSTVKAVANMFKDQGLRLIELKKKQLHQIPELVDMLSDNPLKFILFIDDLSFTKNDDDFAALKAMLEGSVSARTKNIAIYATSNRRHLVQESFSDRNGDDVHYNDTVQELISLSSRFGLTITFMRPDKKHYNEITTDLAAQYGIEMELDELLLKANSFALSKGGYSPRTAKQFIESLAALQ